MSPFNYYHERRKKDVKRFVWFLLVVVVFYFFGAWVLGPLTGPLGLLSRPLWWSGEALFALGQTGVDFFSDHNAIAIQNRKLEEENSRLRILLLSAKNISSDNVFLRAVCGREGASTTPILGRVIFLPNFVPHQTLLVDLGQNNLTRPLNLGDWAISSDNVLLGKVAEIGPWQTKIKLLSAEQDIPVTLGSDNIPALASGAGAGNFAISLPKSTKVEIGDVAKASLYGDYLVGVVRHIEKTPSQPNQIILVKTPVNLWQLKWLELYEAKI